MLADEESYLDYRRNSEKRTVYEYTLNYTLEQETYLLDVLNGYIDADMHYSNSDKFIASYYYTKSSDGLDKYNVVGFGENAVNCAGFVAKALNESIDNLLADGKKAPDKINTLIYTPASIRNSLDLYYSLGILVNNRKVK